MSITDFEIREDYKDLEIKGYYCKGEPAYCIYHIFPNGKYLTIRSMVGFPDPWAAVSKARQYIDCFQERIDAKIKKYAAKKPYCLPPGITGKNHSKKK